MKRTLTAIYAGLAVVALHCEAFAQQKTPSPNAVLTEKFVTAIQKQRERAANEHASADAMAGFLTETNAKLKSENEALKESNAALKKENDALKKPTEAPVEPALPAPPATPAEPPEE